MEQILLSVVSIPYQNIYQPRKTHKSSRILSTNYTEVFSFQIVILMSRSCNHKHMNE